MGLDPILREEGWLLVTSSGCGMGRLLDWEKIRERLVTGLVAKLLLPSPSDIDFSGEVLMEPVEESSSSELESWWDKSSIIPMETFRSVTLGFGEWAI